jgi:hypothetical protein
MTVIEKTNEIRRLGLHQTQLVDELLRKACVRSELSTKGLGLQPVLDTKFNGYDKYDRFDSYHDNPGDMGD